MHYFRVVTVRWAVALFCLIIGSLMLIAPHQFASRTFREIQVLLPYWGVVFLFGGLGLLCVIAFRPPRSLLIVAHTAAAAVLLSLAYAFSTTAAWTGTLQYAILGLAVLAAPWLGQCPPDYSYRHRDLLALAMGLSGVVVGLLILAVPDQFRAPAYDPIRSFLPWYGLAFLIGGLLLSITQLMRNPHRLLIVAAHLLGGGAYLLFGLTFAIPSRGWSATTLYVGMGSVVTLLPFLSEWLDRLDLTTLRMRFAFGLTLAAAVPLTVSLAFITAREETAAANAALEVQRNLAVALAQDVSDYLLLHQAAMTVLSAHPALQADDPSAQRAVLQEFNRAYPDIFAFTSFDTGGQAIARSDDLPLIDLARYRLVEPGSLPATPLLEVIISPLTDRPTFVFSAPVRNQAGQQIGLILALLEADRLIDQMREIGAGVDGVVYLVDEKGRLIAHPDAELLAGFPVLADAPPVIALLANAGGTGSVSYSLPEGGRLTGYARVPNLNWVVMMERPRALALAPLRAGREVVFGVLVLAIVAASLIGTLLARQFTRPLATLARAATRLADDDTTAPLPQTPLSELAQLSASFAAMRDRLAARTAERDQAEHEREVLLRAQEEALALLDTLFATAPVGLGFFDTDLRYARVNAELAAINGIAPADHLGRTVDELLPDVPPEVLQDLRSVLLRNEPIVGREVVGQTPAAPGQERVWLASYYPMRRRNRDLLGIGLVVTEITARKRVEQEQRFLADASRMLAASLDEQATLEAIARLAVPTLADWCVVDMVEQDGSLQTRALIHADPDRLAQGWEVIRRYPRDPAAAYGSAQVVRTGEPELVPYVPDAILDAVAQDADHPRLLRSLGFASTLLVPMKVGRRVLGTIGLVSATPERYSQADLPLMEELARRAATAIDNARLYTAAQEARKQAEAAVHSRDDFLSVAAHELRTPLTSLLGYSKLLQRRLSAEQGLAERDRRAVRVVSEQAERLAELTNSLLDLSRIQVGQLAIDARPLDLGKLLQQLVNEMDLIVENHTLSLDLPDQPLMVDGDEVRLRQLFYNLLQNAVKYSPNGGPVVLHAESEAGKALVSISDQGIGIPSGALANLFQRFFRAHKETAIGGMGIGLYVVGEIAALHGGSVEVRSVEGEGSTFTVHLPLLVPQMVA